MKKYCNCKFMTGTRIPKGNINKAYCDFCKKPERSLKIPIITGGFKPSMADISRTMDFLLKLSEENNDHTIRRMILDIFYRENPQT